MKNNKLFVYGTLMKQSAHPMSVFLRSHSTFLCRGSFPGKLFEVAGYPGANYDPKNSSAVHGEIYLLEAPPFVFSHLDPYESIGPQFPQPHEYVRKLVPINTGQGPSLQCWVYLYNHDSQHHHPIPSGIYNASNASNASNISNASCAS